MDNYIFIIWFTPFINGILFDGLSDLLELGINGDIVFDLLTLVVYSILRLCRSLIV